MSINTGPVRMAIAGDTYTQGARISKILWRGAGTAADTIEIVDPVNGAILYPGMAVVANTLVSENWIKGLSAPNGFKLAQISSGVVYVYLEEA